MNVLTTEAFSLCHPLSALLRDCGETRGWHALAGVEVALTCRVWQLHCVTAFDQGIMEDVEIIEDVIRKNF